jgi:hypothetical protein
MVGISKFLEMKMKAVTFKVYTSKSSEIYILGLRKSMHVLL